MAYGTFSEVTQQLINVVDVTEILYVMSNECRHGALIYVETTVGTTRAHACTYDT